MLREYDRRVAIGKDRYGWYRVVFLRRRVVIPDPGEFAQPRFYWIISGYLDGIYTERRRNAEKVAREEAIIRGYEYDEQIRAL